VAYVDGRTPGAAGTAGGKRRAVGRNRGLGRRRGHGLRRQTDGRAGTSKAGQTDGQTDGLADGPNRGKIARSAILARYNYITLVLILFVYCIHKLTSAFVDIERL